MIVALTLIAAASFIVVRVYKVRRAWLKAGEKSAARREAREITNHKLMVERVDQLTTLEKQTEFTQRAWEKLSAACKDANAGPSSTLTFNIATIIGKIADKYLRETSALLKDINQQRGILNKLTEYNAVDINEHMPDELFDVLYPTAKTINHELSEMGWSSNEVKEGVETFITATLAP